MFLLFRKVQSEESNKFWWFVFHGNEVLAMLLIIPKKNGDNGWNRSGV